MGTSKALEENFGLLFRLRKSVEHKSSTGDSVEECDQSHGFCFASSKPTGCAELLEVDITIVHVGLDSSCQGSLSSTNRTDKTNDSRSECFDGGLEDLESKKLTVSGLACASMTLTLPSLL